MQFTTLATILAAATTISAAPALTKRVDAIPLSIFTGTGCNGNPVPITTAFVPTDGKCFSISPIVAGNVDSGLIRQSDIAALPAGCTLIAYSDGDCTSVNSFVYTTTGECKTFGPGKLINSARTIGTCA